MNSPKSLTAILPANGARFATHIWRNLNCCIGDCFEREMVVLDGPDIWQIAMLDHFVRLALETASAPFLIGETVPEDCGEEKGWHGQRRAVPPVIRARYAVANPSVPAARELAVFLPSLLWCTAIFHSRYRTGNSLFYAPHLRLFFNIFFSHAIAHHYCDNKIFLGHATARPDRDNKLNTNVDHVKPDVAETYNDFVAYCRQTMQADRPLRRELHNWGWGSRQNVAKLGAYLDDLFERHGSLTVLHLRLSHRKADGGSLVPTQEQQHRDLTLLRKARTLFFDRMRRKPALFTAAPGYVWAIMPLINGNYELHLTLLFNSAALRKVLDDKRVEAERAGVACPDHADLVGAYWVTTGTGGQGSYSRGDQHNWLYDPAVWVHGEVRADDGSRPASLKEALGYLALRRSLVRLENEPPGEYFGLPERKPRRSRRSRGSGVRGTVEPGETSVKGTKSSIQNA